MTTAIALNYGISPPHTCRVEVQPLEPACAHSRMWQSGGGEFTAANGVHYVMNGMTVLRYNEGLTLAQSRGYLFPQYFNTGCSTLYCKDGTMCPNSTPVKSNPTTTSMLDYLFENHSDFTGNSAPPGDCSKGTSYSSTRGWELQGNRLKWQLDNDNNNNM